jgi:hypothetical protein
MLSDDALHRYTLVREWNPDRARVLFVMLNPSTADADDDDPTIRRCICFAKSWGFGSLEVVNLSSARCTNPDLLGRLDAFHDLDARELNRTVRADAEDRAALIIFAWGAHKAVKTHLLTRTSRQRIEAHRDKVRVLATNKDGSPKHPLYVRGDAVPIEWETTDV